jgi:hypothetical protein
MNYGCGKGAAPLPVLLRRRLRICGTADFGAEAETEPLHSPSRIATQFFKRCGLGEPCKYVSSIIDLFA